MTMIASIPPAEGPAESSLEAHFYAKFNFEYIHTASTISLNNANISSNYLANNPKIYSSSIVTCKLVNLFLALPPL
jgi:hypothetical protein